MKRSILNKRVLFAAVVVCGLSMPLMAQAQTTDFSGTWSFDSGKSTGKPEPVSLAGGESPEVADNGRIGRGGGGQGAGGREAKPVDAFRLVIKQSPTEISIIDGGVPLLFRVDGPMMGISALGRAGYPKGKATWEGNKLVLSTTQDVYAGRAQFDTRLIKQTFTLEGSTLTIEKTENFQGKTTTIKLVYNKAA